MEAKTTIDTSQILNWVKTKLKPKGWSYITQEEGESYYIGFIAFLALLGKNKGFNFTYTEEEIRQIIDTPLPCGIALDMINGGFMGGSPPCFFASYNKGYPYTANQIMVDFHQHFSLHHIDIKKLPKTALKELVVITQTNPSPLKLASCTIAGDWTKLKI